MSPPRRPAAWTSRPVTWSVVAGLYLFGCGTATAFLLSDVLAVLATVIGLPAGVAMALFASPALVVGPVAWWTVVERRGAYAYRYGGAVGLLTALVSGLVWTGRLVVVWGVGILAADVVWLVVAFVLGVVAIAGGLVGFPLMYARQRLAGGSRTPTRPDD